MTVGGQRSADPDGAHVQIDAQGRASGNYGCNHFTAEARFDGYTVTVEPGTTTERVRQGRHHPGRPWLRQLPRHCGRLRQHPRRRPPRHHPQARHTLSLTAPDGKGIAASVPVPVPVPVPDEEPERSGRRGGGSGGGGLRVG
ncbi:META domain-containing protein [Streptomyces sp. NPDC048332]|uniref:META domain-containing protein n=1 Tax=Streptomyces sp. NPDC048332 TaxID=3154619 RepID=UPI00342DBD1A